MAHALAVTHYTAMAREAAAIAANGVPGYCPVHTDNGGECASTLDDTPVLLRYVLTWDGARELCEVEAVSINGAKISAEYFDAATRDAWASDCRQSRTAAGVL